eukprot:331252_1
MNLKQNKLWKLHDGYYDLSKFMSIHPGSDRFIELTQGQDITYLFETYHINIDIAISKLDKYFVFGKKYDKQLVCNTNPLFTTLRKKIKAYLTSKNAKKGPSLQT